MFNISSHLSYQFFSFQLLKTYFIGTEYFLSPAIRSISHWLNQTTKLIVFLTCIVNATCQNR